MPDSSTFDRAKATEDIRRIIHTYPEAIDRGNVPAVVKLLTGVKMCNSLGITAPEVPEDEIPVLTAADVEAIYKGVTLYEDGLPHTKHVITNIDVEFSDDFKSARTRSFYIVLQALENFPLQIIITGRYEDTYREENGVWKLKIRREYADLLGDLSHHVSPELVAQLNGHEH
jgi:SnoaL-like domain